MWPLLPLGWHLLKALFCKAPWHMTGEHEPLLKDLATTSGLGRGWEMCFFVPSHGLALGTPNPALLWAAVLASPA